MLDSSGSSVSLVGADDSEWVCPHCSGRGFVPSVTDDRIGVCEACRFAFPRGGVDADGSTWRAQARMIDSAAAARAESDGQADVRMKEDGGRMTAGEAPTPQDQKAGRVPTPQNAWPRVRADRYSLVRALGGGAQARIFLAHHRHLDQICVIKVLDEKQDWKELAQARLQAEARAAVRISHFNVARFLDCDCVDGVWYYVMEYVSGENLRNVVGAIGRMEWQQVVEIATQVADGLAAVHDAGLIHRDVKPSNIMLRCDGVPKIMDLGLVKNAGVQNDMTLTHDGQILGTPYYMPPEQFSGDVEVTAAADLYSLGATLFYLLCGRPPHQGGSVVDLANRHKHDPVIWSDDVVQRVPVWLRHVIEMCMAKRPEHRFASAAALGEALRCGADVSAPAAESLGQDAPSGVVVLAFRNLSRRPEDDWIGDAVAEYLSNRLLEVEGLHVVDRHAVDGLRPSADARAMERSRRAGNEATERQRDADVGIRGRGDAETCGWDDAESVLDAARKLGAGVVVTGAFQRNGDAIRLTARAVGALPGPATQVAATVSGSMEELFNLEDELAARVLKVLAADRRPRRGGQGDAGGTRDLEAAEKFVRGKRAFADGDYDAAVALAREALAIDGDYVDAVSLIGACYARIGEYDLAVEHHQREEAVARRDGDQRRLAEALGNIGVMYYYKGQYALAFDFLEQARNLAAEQGQHTDAAKFDGNLGFVLMRLNQDAEAEAAFGRAIEIHKKYHDLVSLAWPYNGMGNVLLKQKRYAEAEEYYRRALALAREIGNRVNTGVCHMNLGRCACLMGEYAEAEACFDEALQSLERTNFWNGLTLVYEYTADMYLQEGNTEAAMRAVERRLELAQKHGNQRMEAEAWEQKAKAFEQAGDKEAALQCLKRSLEASQRPAPHQSLSRYLSEISHRAPFR